MGHFKSYHLQSGRELCWQPVKEPQQLLCALQACKVKGVALSSWERCHSTILLCHELQRLVLKSLVKPWGWIQGLGLLLGMQDKACLHTVLWLSTWTARLPGLGGLVKRALEGSLLTSIQVRDETSLHMPIPRRQSNFDSQVLPIHICPNHIWPMVRQIHINSDTNVWYMN